MPTMSALLRRRGQTNDAQSRRHSYFGSETHDDSPVDDEAGGRPGEQLARKPSVASVGASSGMNVSATVKPVLHSPEHREEHLEPPIPLPIQTEANKHRRFSMLRFRHASDSQLGNKARQQAELERAPSIPTTPSIITTAPAGDVREMETNKVQTKFPGRLKIATDSRPSSASVIKKERRKTMSETGPAASGRVTFDNVPGNGGHGIAFAPPAYGDEASSTLALPVNRLSESSNASSADHGVYATTVTTTHTVHTTTTFFRLPRRKKSGPLFPLPPRVIAPEHGSSLAVPTTSGMINMTNRSSTDSAAARAMRANKHSEDSARFASPQPSPQVATASSSMIFPAPASGTGNNNSATSGRSSPIRKLGMRSRSSTLSSIKNVATEDLLPTPNMAASTRTSTSTGRKSFGDLFSISHRLRQNSEPLRSGPDTPGSGTSKNNSIQLAREPIVIPERREDETPSKYLVRLEEAVSRGVVASVVSRGSDTFSQQVLRSYMRGFGFFGDPMDMAIRKLLMEVELPKETQHIDRCLQAFANRYEECNPGIYASPDQAYFIAFSLLILHTDVFNKNNKHKMQRQDYLKNTQGEGIFDEILECFYDNISYTPFIHVEDDIDINGERIIQHKTKKKSSIFPRSHADPTRKLKPLKEPIDPYTLIIDSNLEVLRPNLKEVMYVEEHYNYLGTAQSLNLQDLQKTFFRTGVLQIVSVRSRPDAFMTEKTLSNPEEAHPGIVDIKITKVGLLWRKDAKKKKTRSPWQEWGAILTGAQLYFFRNTAWVKSLMHQYESHIKQGNDGIPVIFKPPLEQFKPDALMSTDDAVALLDSTYKKHKNAFVFVRHGGFEEVFLADSEDERNDWLAKLNYAAAFRTSGVRMRGVVGGNYDGQRSRGIRRLDSASSTSRSIQTSSGEVTIVSGKIDNKMAQDILAARREIMIQKISDAEEKLRVLQSQLDLQLRNARHLQILAPIQPKTRDQVVLAAGRMAAKLKWARMEIWRLKCHRDILVMDLEEERDQANGKILDTEPTLSPHTTTEKPAIGRLDSSVSATVSLQRTPRSPSIRTSTQPVSPKDINVNNVAPDDMLPSQPPLQSASTYHKAQASWELPPLTSDAQSGRHPSGSSSLAKSPILSHTASFPSIRHSTILETTGPNATSQPDANERTILQQAGLMEMNGSPESKPIETVAEDVKDPVKDHPEPSARENEKLDRGKIRRSLHRTLREAHVPTHHRSRKGKDSSSSVGISDETNTATDDVLSRGTGSFVVHGKKASVITFGEEFSHISPDERLRLKKQPHKAEPGKLVKSAVDDDFSSVTADPIEQHEHHEHRDSAASASTATARSFRELHKRLSAHAATLGSTLSDGDDSEAAVSFSDGRRTPLPPVEDMEEDGTFEQSPWQAAFYSPDAPRSPDRDRLEEKGKGRMGSPIQAVGA